METASICRPKKRRLHETTPQVSVARQKVSDVCFIIQQIETDIPGVAYEDVSDRVGSADIRHDYRWGVDPIHIRTGNGYDRSIIK
jgi:hypothetical protein